MVKSKQKNGFFQNLDYLTIFLYLLLVGLGWLTIYAASYDVSLGGELALEGRITSQIVWMGISMGVAIVVLLIDSQFIKLLSPYLYSAFVLLLIATIFLAPDIKGSHSWLVVTDSIRLQPAEFAKVATALMLAWWRGRYEFDIRNPRDLFVSILIFALPALIIILQSETGSALVFLTFILVLYREGLTSAVHNFGIFLATLFVLSLRFAGVMWGDTNAGWLVIIMMIYIAIIIASLLYCHVQHLNVWALIIAPSVFGVFGIASIFTVIDFSVPAGISLAVLLFFIGYQAIGQRGKFVWLLFLFGILSIGIHLGVDYFFNSILQPHQQTRILVSLGLKDDPAGAGYNLRQSLIAIGSGGTWGKGFLNGIQTKLSFVPEQETDFIFCTVGEEQGFVGSVIVLLIYLSLLVRLIIIAERQSEAYARVYGYSVTCILFFHLTINIGMVLGLVPVIGIPLPYFSYGGSSLLSFTILLFLLLRLDALRRE